MFLIDTDQLTVRIAALPERRFAQLCNDVLNAAAASAGIQRTHFDLTLNTAEPEGGLDARSCGVPLAAGRLIPTGDAGYQYKSGAQKKSAALIAREDIVEKPRVLELLMAGGTFVYLAGWDRASKIETEVRKAASKLGIEFGAEQFVFVTAHTLAQILQAHPATLARYFGVEANLLPLGQWSAIQPLTNPFCIDDVLDSQLAALRAVLEVGSGPVRLVGAPGDGKTRLVLESLRVSPLAESVLYSPQREHVTPNLVGYLRSNPDVQCTLVVDEVDDAGAEDLARLFASMPPGVRLLTIGQDAGPPQAKTLQVQGLSEDLLVEAIGAIAHALPAGVAREIARACNRSPKLAVLIAQRIAEQPALVAPHRILADGSVQRTLDRYLGITPGNPEWEALSCFALLQRVGWTEDAEAESEILFRAVRREPKDGRRAVEEVHRRTGIAPRAGRFRYVSPAILGDHLAARQLAVWPRKDVVAFLEALTPAMARSFGLRVRRMAEVLENRQVVEEVVLGDEGPFRTLGDLTRTPLATLLPVFAPLFPQAMVACLRRMVGRASDEELQGNIAGRRTLVEVLTDLLWRADTFPEAARLLLRLAANENESWGNNATSTWIETFQIRLGRTAAGPPTRLRVLREALHSDNPAERSLAAAALGRACELGYHTRGGKPPVDVPDMPGEAWHPTTYAEWFEVVRSYYDLLGSLLADANSAVRVAAAKALRQGTRAAIRFPVTDEWIAAARHAIGGEYIVRSELLAGVEDHLARHGSQLISTEETDEDYEGEPIPDPKIHRLALLSSVADELRSGDFGTRFRWAIQREFEYVHATEYESIMREKDDVFRALMREVVHDPVLLDEQWQWLAEQTAGSGRWAYALGSVDRDRAVAEIILAQAAQNPTGAYWLAEYETGYAKGEGGDGWVDRRLVELVERGATGAVILPLMHRAGVSTARVDLATHLFADGRLAGEAIARFVYTDWTELGSPEIETLLAASTRSSSPPAIVAAIHFLAVMLRRGRPWSDALRSMALDLVQRTPVLGEQSRVADDWALVASEIIVLDPQGVAAAALRQIGESALTDEEDLVAVLERAWDLADKAVLLRDHIGPAITRQDVIGWRVRDRLERFGMPGLSISALRAWIDEKPEARAPAVAELAGAPDVTASELQGVLLEHYDDYGVGSTLIGHLISGVHWGPESEWLTGKRAMVEGWLKDARPAVRAWAESAISALDDMLARARKREEEEAIRWL